MEMTGKELLEYYKKRKQGSNVSSEETTKTTSTQLTGSELMEYYRKSRGLTTSTEESTEESTTESAWDKYKGFANSEEGSKGWQKYLADQEASKQSAVEEKEDEKWWEKIGRWLGSGGAVDTSLPMGTTTQTIHSVRDTGLPDYTTPADDWNDEQRNIFGYLYSSNPDEASKYAEYLNTEAKEKAKIKEIQDSATSNFGAGAAHTAGAILTAPLGLADFLNDLVLANAGASNTRYDGEVSPFEYSQAVKGGISEHLNYEYGTIDESVPIIGGKGWGDVYGVGTEIVESTYRGLFGLPANLGMGWASRMDDALERGATEDQAFLIALIAGTAEGLLEQKGIDNFFKFGAAPTLKVAIKNVLKQAGAEGIEEGLTSIIDNIADNAVMQDKSNFNAMVKAYMEQGMTEEKAKQKAWMESIEGIAYDTIVGGVSGGIHAGAITSVRSAIDNHNASKLYGYKSQMLIDDALAVENNSKLRKLAEKYKGRVEKGKNLTGGQINNLINTADTAKLKNSILQRLGELGETSDVTPIADVLVRQAMGEELSSKDTNILNNSKAGYAVLTEINKDNIESGGLSNKWAENIGTMKIHPESYNKGAYELAKIVAEAKENKAKASVEKEIAESGGATEAKIEVSDNGKNMYYDAETDSYLDADIKRVVSTKGGIKVELGSGKTVSASDLRFTSREEGVVYEMLARMDVTPDTANEILNTFKPSNEKQASLYYDSIPLAYRMGLMGNEQGLKYIKLSDAQKRVLYNRGRIDAISNAKERGRAIATSPKNATAEASKTGEKGIIYEGGYVYDEANANALQKMGISGAEAIAKTTNLEVHVFESKVENGKRVAYVNGKLVSAPNGYFTDGNKIYIDVNAGMLAEGAMLYALAHEVTHYIRKWNPKGFKVLADFLMAEYGKQGVDVTGLIARQKEKIKKRYNDEGKTLPNDAQLFDMAYEELVADAMSDMLADPKAYEKLAKLKQKNFKVWKKLGEVIKQVLDKLKDALNIYRKDSPVAQEAFHVRNFSAEAYNKLQDLYIKAFVEADNNYSSAEQTLVESGIAVNPNTDSASLMSVRDVLNDDQRKKVSLALAERFGVTQQEAMDWLKAETSMASLILNPKYSQYLDYTPDPNEVAIKTNSDYPQGTVDFSPICAKRREFTSVMNNILRLFPNHVFAAADLAKIRTIMQEEGMTIPCGICYVEDRRQLDTIVAQNFIDSLKLYREGSKTRPDGKPFNTNQLKGLSLIDGDSYTPSVYELVSLEGLNLLKEKNPNMAEAWVKFNNARGMQSVRLLANEAEYKRQILKYSKKTVQTKNDHGGLRVYSFSDAEMFHLIDIIQVITDSATVGLSLQGYTKVNEYARAVKDTGEKLNRSLIPKGELGYHIEDGKVVLDYDTVEGIDINHPDFFDNRDNPNVGNITIGVNDVQIRAAMVSDFVDQIIPFHTGQSEEVLGEKGIATWSNYKDFQTEKDISTGKVSDHQINIYTEVLQVLEKEGKHINKRTFVEKFLQVCKDNGLTPRFSQFLNTNENGEYVYTEGYHKMLVDFKTFAQTEVGEYLPQMPVKPIFDNEYITKILKDYVKSQKVKDAELAESMPKVIERITNEIVKPGEVKYSDRVVDLSDDSELSALVNGVHGAKRYKAIAEYILNAIEGGSIAFNDGLKAIVDKRDAAHIAHGAGKHKVNQIAKIKDLINQAVVYAEENDIDHNKFNQFLYYECIVKYDGEVFPLYLNVGKGINDGKYHLYDITKKIRDTANRINGLERPKPNEGYAQENDISKGIVSQKEEIVKSQFSDILYSDRVLMGSLFSGGGTLEAGLVYQMLDKEFAVEYNRKIASVYTDNHGKEHMFVGDVRDFNSKEKRNVFYLHASPVCKNFSPASHSGGETTLDITTAQATARVLEEQMPQVFTVENVKRYIGSEAYNIITNKLDELGYTWDVAVYKASDYGNATKRERMIIRAVKSGQLPAKPQKASNITSWGEATRDLWETDLIPSNLVRSKIEAIKNTPSLKGVKLTKLDKPLLIYDTTKSKTINYAWADELAPTLTTKCGDARIIMPDGRVYAPTPKFMGRIQGLPDDYKYPKAVTNAFKIIGNGIPTQLTKAVMGGVLDSAYEQTHDGEILYSDRDTATSLTEADITYSIREEAPPKKTVEGYKVFVVKNGKLYPPMVANPNAVDTPVGVWLNADVGTRAADSKTGRPQVKAGGKGTQGGSGSLAFRPGWHLGETPLATQFDRLNPETGVKELFPENFVWALCDIAADHDYQEEAMSYGYTKNGKFQHSLAGLPKLPKDGYYKYRTNPNPDTVPWLITGAMKVKKLLSDAEVNAILESKGLTPKQRVGGNKTLADLGLSEYEGVVYSDRDTDSVSNRTLLANALESVAKNDIEKAKLDQYKDKIALIEAEQKKLNEIRAEAQELRTKKGRIPEETKKMRDLDFMATQTANRINTYDKQLLNLESTSALKNVLEREKTNLRKRLEQKGKEALQAQRAKNAETVREIMTRNTESRKKAVEGRHKTEMRHRIKKLLQRLNKLLKGGKESNVKEEMKETVATALALGDILFGSEISNIDIVKLGVESVTEKESKLLNEYSDILTKKALNDERIESIRKGEIKEDSFPYISELEEQNRKYDRRIAVLNKELSDLFVRERARLNRTPVATLIYQLATEYHNLKTSEVEYIKSAYNDELFNKLIDLKKDLGGVTARDMSMSQLEKVHKVFTMIEHSVRTANQEFRNGKWEDLQENASKVMEEIDRLKDTKQISHEMAAKLKSYLWNELTPYYAFDKIGSETLMGYFWDLIKGQSVAARDFEEANNFASATREKYGYSKWKLDKVYDFQLNDGRTFSTTLKHLLSVYAFSKREQADLHVSIGGFFHNDKATFRKEKGILKMVRTDAVGYKVDDVVLAQIKEVLGKEKMSYVDDMLDYLTKTMGEKGNEVSRVVWGVDIFTEKVYFPLKSKEDFLKKSTETATAVSLKNDGMTKETVPGASNPIVLEAFDDVWANHVEKMSTYHGLVIPIDNLNKVLHYGTWVGTDAMSVSTMLEGKFTSAATDYLEQWINDLNGGTMVKGATNPFMSFFSKFKKTVVGASLSTIVQQPTAIIRAMAEIDAKYFVGKPNRTKVSTQWDEFKKYAPIAIIKEIGGFDAGGGKSASRWINSNTLTGVDKVMNTVDDISMKGAEIADQIGWLTIWEAVKRETAETTNLKVDSQEFLEKCGERATEVIVKTQVYDSTLSRSGFMRSKSDGVKMITSFMGEPTLSINMMYSAVINALRGGKEAKIKAAKTIGYVYVAIILAEALASAIYALRDDDEDESYMEKYLQSFGSGMVSDVVLAPVTSLPGVKDIVSIFQGWDVERSDMAIFKDIKDAFDGLDSESKSPYRKVEDFAGAIAAAFGLPLKNVLRTGREVYNAGSHIFDDVSGGSAWDAFSEGITGNSTTDSKSLYKAIIKGDSSRYRKQYKTEAAYETAVRNALRENDPRIRKAAQARYEGDIAEYTRIAKEIIREGHFSQDIVVGAINAELNAIKRGEAIEPESTEGNDEITSIYSGSDINAAFNNGDFTLAKEIILDLIETKVSNGMEEKSAKSSLKSSMTSYWKPLYKQAYQSGDTSEMLRIRQILYASGLYGTANDVVKTVQSWARS